MDAFVIRFETTARRVPLNLDLETCCEKVFKRKRGATKTGALYQELRLTLVTSGNQPGAPSTKRKKIQVIRTSKAAIHPSANFCGIWKKVGDAIRAAGIKRPVKAANFYKFVMANRSFTQYIKDLDLSSIGINELPGFLVDKLVIAKNLNLSNNSFTSLPKSLIELKKCVINISYNPLQPTLYDEKIVSHACKVNNCRFIFSGSLHPKIKAIIQLHQQDGPADEYFGAEDLSFQQTLVEQVRSLELQRKNAKDIESITN
jgi:hypothetical protein